MSSEPFSCASISATSSLMPVARTTSYATPSWVARSSPGAAPSRYPWTRTSAPLRKALSDTERMTVTEARLHRRELDPLGQQLPFLAQVAHRVLRERLERLGDPAALFSEC